MELWVYVRIRESWRSTSSLATELERFPKHNIAGTHFVEALKELCAIKFGQIHTD